MQALYQLQRGQLLGKAACHADERAFLHAMFTAAPPGTAEAMLAPALHLREPFTGAFHAVLAADIALTPGAPTAHGCCSAWLLRCGPRGPPHAYVERPC